MIKNTAILTLGIMSCIPASGQWNYTSKAPHVYYTVGNVGIGTPSPSTMLHISGGSPRLTLSDTYGDISATKPHWSMISNSSGGFQIQTTVNSFDFFDRFVLAADRKVISAGPMLKNQLSQIDKMTNEIEAIKKLIK